MTTSHSLALLYVQITLIGLLLVGCSHLLFAIYCPFLDGDAPAWLFVVAALALFAYQVRQPLVYRVVTRFAEF